jgi:hypothetical protein
MMARSDAAPFNGRIQKRKTDPPDPACNARPLHTKVPVRDIGLRVGHAAVPFRIQLLCYLNDNVKCLISVGFRQVKLTGLKSYDELPIDSGLREIDAPVVIDCVDQSKVMSIEIGNVLRFMPKRK